MNVPKVIASEQYIMEHLLGEKNTTVINSIIGNGTEYIGDIVSVDLLRIDGAFSGSAKSQDAILIGEYGKVKGKLTAPRIIIAGMFQGVIEQCRVVLVQSTAIILGGINSQNVVVEPGAIISGLFRTSKSINDVRIDERREYSKEISTRVIGSYSSKGLDRLFSIGS